MPTTNIATIWSGFGDARDAVDAMIGGVCCQTGYYPGITPEARNPWKLARTLKPNQVQWLAWNSQMKPVTRNPTDWRLYAYNTIPLNDPRWRIWTVPNDDPVNKRTVVNLTDPNYARAWALNAMKFARTWERLTGNHWDGIFADSICYGWWWPFANPYGDSSAYRKAQEQFCQIVGDYVRSHGMKFGANVGVTSTGYRAWPEVLQHLDLVFSEHVYPGLAIDPVITTKRKYVLAVHPDSKLEPGAARSAEVAAQASRLAGLLGPNDYVCFGTDDVRDRG